MNPTSVLTVTEWLWVRNPPPNRSGIQDSKLSEKLQMTPDLTLESAVIEARQSEAVKKQQSVVCGEVLRE